MPKVNDLKYLKHLARLGAVNIHPGGKRATTQLLANLSIMDGHHILDIGCGTGETMVRIASRRDVFITGIDVLPEMLEKAENRVKFSGLSDRIKVQPVSEGSPLPFSNERFDRVFTESAICFHDLNSARTLLNEIHRILKVHGIYAANEAIWKDGIDTDTINEINRNAERDFGLRPSSPEALYLRDWLNIFYETGFEVISFNSVNGDNSKNHPAFNSRIFFSGLFTFTNKLKIIFHPSLLAEYFRYKRIMRNHRQNTPVLEGRLFVMRKRN